MTPVDLIEEMIRADLELAFDHLINGQLDLFEHQLDNAKEKSRQIRNLKLATLQPATNPQPLLTLDAGPVTVTPAPEPNHDQTPSRPDPKKRRRKAPVS